MLFFSAVWILNLMAPNHFRGFKCCNAKFLQISSEKLIYVHLGWLKGEQIFIFEWTTPLKKVISPTSLVWWPLCVQLVNTVFPTWLEHTKHTHAHTSCLSVSHTFIQNVSFLYLETENDSASKTTNDRYEACATGVTLCKWGSMERGDSLGRPAFRCCQADVSFVFFSSWENGDIVWRCCRPAGVEIESVCATASSCVVCGSWRPHAAGMKLVRDISAVSKAMVLTATWK